MHELIAADAVKMRDLLARRALGLDELLDVLETHVAATDAGINALPTRCFEPARAARVPEGALLAGLPVPINDLTDVASVRGPRRGRARRSARRHRRAGRRSLPRPSLRRQGL